MNQRGFRSSIYRMHFPFMLAAICSIMNITTNAQETPNGASPPRPPVTLTDEAVALHKSALVVDGHNDLPWSLRSKEGGFNTFDIAKRQDSGHTDIPRLREGGLGAQFWSVYVPNRLAYNGTALATTIEQIELVKLMIERYPGDFGLALSTDDIRRVRAEGKIASLIGVEGGYSIEESLANLRRLYGLGARYMTLTHSDSLSWADSATDDPISNGLSPFGEDVVREMNRLGMLVDLSHVSPDVMKQAIRVSQAPVIFSHSSARAVADHPRNVPDDVLKLLPERDGVVMVNFFSGFVVPEAATSSDAQLRPSRGQGARGGERGDANQAVEQEARAQAERRQRQRRNIPRGTIHVVLDHIDHIAKTAGVKHVGLGSDYDGVSVLPEQLEDVSRYPYMTQGLLDRGYTPEQIRGILGGNLMRVFRGAEETAMRMAVGD
jgi:membrane dipeptidase